MKKLTVLILAVFMAAVMAVGCAGPSSKTVDARFEEAIKQKEKFNDVRNTVTSSDDSYVGSPKVVPLEKTKTRPPFLKKRIVLIEGSMTMPLLAQRLSQILGFPVEVAPLPKASGGGGAGGPVDPNAPGATSGRASDNKQKDKMGAEGMTMTVNYNGSVEGLLDTIAGRFGLQWEWDENRGIVLFFKVKTRNFTLLANPGKVVTKSKISNKSDSGSSSSSGGSSGGAPSNENSTTGEQSLEFQSDVDVWKQTVESVKGMLSEYGSVMQNEAGGTLTVTDMPIILDRVDAYLKGVNSKLSRQAAITFRVYAVTVNDESSFNFNIAASLKNFGFDIVTTAGGMPAASTMDGLAGSSSITGTVVDNGKNNSFRHIAAGSTAFLQALNQWGKASILQEQTLVTLHQQTTPVQIVNSRSYLAKMSTTNTTNVGTNTSMEPGVVTTGFSLLLTPNILNNNSLVLQYSLTISDLVNIDEETAGDSRIQLPNVDSRSFYQRVALKAGNTLVIGGFERNIEGNDKGYGLFSFGRTAKRERQVIVITISVDNVEGAGSDMSAI